MEEYIRRQEEFEEAFAQKDYPLARAILGRMNTIMDLKPDPIHTNEDEDRDIEEEIGRGKKSIYFYLAPL